ncbi:M56 family metallopeptidase [Nocardia sp. NBC_01503]|uniref:M56 family metallopeptidase n=1 Tax=Nocardia sp. NBC_01503 TaxID=2975997 RepID=UPI002E7B5ACE|nr:M56 family metallopeptidase [Nocardia sp. NBC_01503]WTL30452.1 M56 family metallopeptidase [Nocardia sp. NBC_01503]
MSISACLALYGFAVAVLAPRLLRRVGHEGATPRVALAAWLASMASTVLAWAVALIILILDLATHRVSTVPQRFMDSCLLHLHDAAIGRYGMPVQAGLLMLSGLSALAAGFVAARLVQTLLRARRTTHEHAQMARLAGRHHARLDAVILDVDQPAAYCVAGKPHTVVISRGVIRALTDDHLEAVLSHERAHLAGRHHLVLALTRGLATVMPRIDLFTVGAAEVARLLEMIADDAAARIHGRGTVLQALLTLSGIAQGPVGALGAAEVGLAARVERLSAPAAPALRLRARLALITAAASAALIPLASVVAAAIGLVVCTPIE